MLQPKSALMLVALFTVTVSMAQAQTATGTILGTVSEESGSVIPNASITVTSSATRNSRMLTTNAEGLFSAPALLAGDYEVRVEAPGFSTQVRDAQVLAGSNTTVNFSMKLGATKEVVTVEAATAQINYDSHTVAGSIQRQTIEELPLNGRSFLQLAALEPGVTVHAQATSSRNSPIAISILGGVAGATLLTLDGLKIMDTYSNYRSIPQSSAGLRFNPLFRAATSAARSGPRQVAHFLETGTGVITRAVINRIWPAPSTAGMRTTRGRKRRLARRCRS
jgi:hypothetical protein